MTPTRALRPCSRPGCPELVESGACEAHRRERSRTKARARNRDGDRREALRFYNSAKWHRIRAAKLRRDPLCETCEEDGSVVEATEVDHIDGDRENNDRGNLRSQCKPCHSRKTVLQDGGFGR